ncbi:MAG: FAD-dependent oxidoreductase [Bacillota bacterium]
MSDIRITIDGRECMGREGQTVLEIARDNGIEIPTLCHDDRISVNTSCFVCIVRDGDSGKWMPSCSAPATDGMNIESSTPEVLDMRKTALELLLSEHCGDCEAPCTLGCPAHAPVEEYVRAGKEGDHLRVLELIKPRIPLPMSIGRVCPRFCEKECRRNIEDEPVAINDFKRLAADLHYEEYMEDLPALTGEKVAIVGAGPAGLSAAYILRLEGISSDIFDKMPEPGGMLRYGIPEYRLPKDILDREIAHFDRMGGIDIHSEQELGVDVQLEDLRRDYNAVIVAVGSWRASSMRVEGEDLAQGGIDFLERLARGGFQMEDPGETVVVGGGNTAMDCVRSAIRLTESPVHCLYRRTEAEMPAEQIEIDEAREEGVDFQFLTQPTALRRDGDKLVLTCMQMELGEPDASGRRRPVPVEGSEFEVAADTVIAAIGQKTVAPADLPTNDWGDVDVDEFDCRVGDGIFAAGDCVTGPATVVEAMAGARVAALAALAEIRGEEYEPECQINVSRGHWQSMTLDDVVFLQEVSEKERVPLRHIDLQRRMNSFDEVTFTFTPEEITREGERCFECSCTAKADCGLRDLSTELGADPERYGGEKPGLGYDASHPEIILDRGKCVKCGICVKVCDEVVNEHLLGFKFRGYDTRIDTAFSQTLPLDCSECGECIESCPVGALDWKKKDREA